LVGNPKGVVSSHHEKLVLIDAEYNNRCVAFTGVKKLKVLNFKFLLGI